MAGAASMQSEERRSSEQSALNRRQSHICLRGWCWCDLPNAAAWRAEAERRLLRARRVRHNRGVRVERDRENVFTVTLTGQELSALVAGARLALDAMRASADAPAAAIELLGRVLDDFDRCRERLSERPGNGDRR